MKKGCIKALEKKGSHAHTHIAVPDPFAGSPALFFCRARVVYDRSIPSGRCFTRNLRGIVVCGSCHHPLGTEVLFRAKATTPTLSKRGVIGCAVLGVADTVCAGQPYPSSPSERVGHSVAASLGEFN